MRRYLLLLALRSPLRAREAQFVALPFFRSTLRLAGLKAWAYSGLTLSGASLLCLKRRGLAPSNGSKDPNPLTGRQGALATTLNLANSLSLLYHTSTGKIFWVGLL